MLIPAEDLEARKRAVWRESLLVWLPIGWRRLLGEVAESHAARLPLELGPVAGREEIRHALRYLAFVVDQWRDGAYVGEEHDIVQLVAQSDSWREVASAVDKESWEDAPLVSSCVLANLPGGFQRFVREVERRVITSMAFEASKVDDLPGALVRWELFVIARSLGQGIYCLETQSVGSSSEDRPLLRHAHSLLEVLSPLVAMHDEDRLYGRTTVTRKDEDGPRRRRSEPGPRTSRLDGLARMVGTSAFWTGALVGGLTAAAVIGLMMAFTLASLGWVP